jgi:putative ABC transport system permease protein
VLSAIDLGLIYALLALGVFLTFRILNFADLTVDASFVTGGGTAALCIIHGLSPWLATGAGFLAGAVAGLVTGLLHTKLKIDPLLASILNMLALYSINLRIMGAGNLSLLRVRTLFTPLQEARLIGSWLSVLLLGLLALLAKLVLDWFLSTDFGLAVQATGDNLGMAASLGVSTDWTKIVTLMLANGLVGLSGAVMAQYQGFIDIGSGTGLILAGLASVIIGNAILGTRFMFLATLGVVVGSVVYRLVIFFALKWEFFRAQDMKLISAVMVIAALVLSQSKTLRNSFSRLSPWRPKADLPEPMGILPTPGAPLTVAASPPTAGPGPLQSVHSTPPVQPIATAPGPVGPIDPVVPDQPSPGPGEA